MTQIVTKFIQDNAVTGAKMRLGNNETFRARNFAGSADVDLFKLNVGDVFEMLKQPTAAAALPIPTSSKDYITVEYATNYLMGKTDAKDAVNLLADTDVPLTGSTPLTIDSTTATNGMRIALTGQTTDSQNGVYDLAITGGTYTLTRSTDFDQVNDAGGNEVTTGAYFKVISGTVYSGWEAILTTTDPITIGTTSLTFALNPTTIALSGGDMIMKVGNDFSVDLATNGGLESTSPGSAAGQLRVMVDTAALEKYQTTRLDPSSGAVVARMSRKQAFTLSSTDITNQYIDLDAVAGQNSINFWVDGGGTQNEVDDYTVNYTGGTAGKTRITFAGGLATGGVSALVATDNVTVTYTSFVSSAE